MRKHLIIGLAIVLLASACGQKDTPQTEFEPLAAEDVAPTTEVIEFSEEREQDEAGEETLIVLPAIGSESNSTAVSPVATPVSPVSKPATEIGGTMMDDSQVPAEAQALTAKAIEMLMQRAEVNAAEAISVKNVESREWANAGLGCPMAGMMYAAVITPGYLIELETGGKTYEFHTNTQENVVLCAIDGVKVAK